MTSEPEYRIGDLAREAGVSPRTLRYYEELGLLVPSGHTDGGERRYSAADKRYLNRIIECKELLGMNLEEIKDVVATMTRLEQLRELYRAEPDMGNDQVNSKRIEILEEALAERQRLLSRLDEKLARLTGLRDQVLGDAQRCEELLGQFRLPLGDAS